MSSPCQTPTWRLAAVVLLLTVAASCSKEQSAPANDDGGITDVDGGIPDVAPGDTMGPGGDDAKINQPPVASGGADQQVATGAAVTLDGSSSSDPDNDTLAYSWQLISVPTGSVATLSDATAESPTFTADVDGAYVVGLIVNDGVADSAEDIIVITAATVDPVPVNHVNIEGPEHWQYKDGPTGGTFNTVKYYEVTKDYVIDLKPYFASLTELPGKYAKWDKTEAQRQIIVNHMKVFFAQLIKWDFVELEDSVLTVKKGYRWDGASTPWNVLNLADNREFYLRCSAVHDALYDLMRMGYLVHDEAPALVPIGSKYAFNEPQFLNRFIADAMIYMIMIEDGRNDGMAFNAAQADFETIRNLGAGKTHNDSMLGYWKYHVSELAAWPSGGTLELHWKPADIAGKDPNGYVSKPHSYGILKMAGTSPPQVLGPVSYGLETYDDKKVYFTDTNVTTGTKHTYRVGVVTGTGNEGDQTDVTVVYPTSGPGNALHLRGYYEFVEADTLPGDLRYSLVPMDERTLELWVKPEYHPDASAILALNDPEDTGNDHVLYYDGPNQKFCFKDKDNDVCSASAFVAWEWHHVAITVKPVGQGALWVDGQQEATFQSPHRPKKSSFFSIGQERSATKAFNHFKGWIDEVRVWTKARSAAQLTAGMCSPMRGDEAGLIGLWHFDESTDSKELHDSTINGHLATIYGMASGLDPLAPSGAMSSAAQCAP